MGYGQPHTRREPSARKGDSQPVRAQRTLGTAGQASRPRRRALAESRCTGPNPLQGTQKMGTSSERLTGRQLMVESVVSLPPAPRGVHAIRAAQERRAAALPTDHPAESGEQ